MQGEFLEGLLAALGPDPAGAGAAYRQIHQRLVRFFSLNHCHDPEALADESMDRLGRRITLREPGDVDSPQAYALGIARHVLQEEIRNRVREEQTAMQWAALADSKEDNAHEELLQALEHCMGTLREDQQQLLRSYYLSTGHEKIQHHRKLAESLGLSVNALRNRVMRARKELDRCVRTRCDVSPDRDTTR